LIGLVAPVVAVGALGACKTKSPQRSSALRTADEYGDHARMSTPQLWSYLNDKLLQQKSQKAADDGTDPALDIWDYYVDPISVGKLKGIKVDNHRDFFGVALKDLQVCLPQQKRTVDGAEKCYAYDNLMRYFWGKGGRGEVLQNPKDWYVNVIPQFYGGKQPAMKRFTREGDIIVYFHPEYRSDALDNVLQWRTTHAATIIERPLTGSSGETTLLTVDTPAGYAKPFNGADDTTFHVFRFVPRGTGDNWDVADMYGKQIARWGTLAFDKFGFQGDYGVMADNMRSPADIARFKTAYLAAGNGGENTVPRMYCAWFAWTNLTLGWNHPFSRDGIGAEAFDGLVGTRFADLRETHAYAGGDFDTGYKIPDNMADNFKAKREFAVTPMTAPELLLGFLDRIVGSDTSAINAEHFVGMAKQKAGILAGMAQNPGIAGKFQVEQREGIPPDQLNATQYNEKIIQTFMFFAGFYNDISEKVAGGQVALKDAKLAVNAELNKIVAKEWTTTAGVSRKWIPPYGFMHHAEYGYANYRKEGEPVLVYVGTVIHEKFLRKKGEQPGSKKMAVVAGTKATDKDRALDKRIYEILGCEVKDDGLGFMELLKHFDPATDYRCPDGAAGLIKAKFNDSENKVVMTMLADWRAGQALSPRDVFVRNTFGLDPVLMRRLLVSFWNNPTVHFKPAIYEGEAASVESAATNLRILLADPLDDMAAEQANPDLLNNQGHPRRTTAMSCVARARPVSAATCESFARDFDATAPTEPNNPDMVPLP